MNADSLKTTEVKTVLDYFRLFYCKLQPNVWSDQIRLKRLSKEQLKSYRLMWMEVKILAKWAINYRMKLRGGHWLRDERWEKKREVTLFFFFFFLWRFVSLTCRKREERKSDSSSRLMMKSIGRPQGARLTRPLLGDLFTNKNWKAKSKSINQSTSCGGLGTSSLPSRAGKKNWERRTRCNWSRNTRTF